MGYTARRKEYNTKEAPFNSLEKDGRRGGMGKEGKGREEGMKSRDEARRRIEPKGSLSMDTHGE
jgi:hypothetical protein